MDGMLFAINMAGIADRYSLGIKKYFQKLEKSFYLLLGEGRPRVEMLYIVMTEFGKEVVYSNRTDQDSAERADQCHNTSANKNKFVHRFVNEEKNNI